MHDSNSINIEGLNLNQINEIFNKCKYFYCYDPNSAYTIFASVCGCIPIIYQIDGINEHDYFTSRMYYFDGTVYNKGIVYGNNINKINYILENKSNENNEEYYRNLFKMYADNTIKDFLKDLELYLTNTPNLPYWYNVYS
jgi:hypothetical protein